MGPKAGKDVLEREKSLIPTGIRTPDRPAAYDTAAPK